MTQKRLTLFLFLLFLGLMFRSAVSVAQDAPDVSYRLGVLAERGKPQCLRQWTATADYLSARVPGAVFELVPLDFEEAAAAVRQGQVDFLITDPVFFLELQQSLGVRGIATLRDMATDGTSPHVSGILFVRSGRKDLLSFRDLKGKKVMAVSELSLGGWLAVYADLLQRKVIPSRYFSGITFGQTVDAVVSAVRTGQVDAGIIPSNMLEELRAEGKINRDSFAVLQGEELRRRPAPLPVAWAFGQEKTKTISTTALYPGWLFAVMKSVPPGLANRAAVILLGMEPDAFAAVRGHYGGWNILEDYQPLFRYLGEIEVGLSPGYQKTGLQRFYRQHKFFVLSMFVLIILTVLVAFSLMILNRTLSRSERRYRKLFENMSSGVAVYSVVNKGDDFVFKDFNQAAESVSQLKREDILGQSVRDVFPSVGDMGLFEIFKRVYHSGMPELFNRTKYQDKRVTIWVRNYVYKLSSTEIVAVFDDITEQVHAEERIQHQNDFLNAILNTIHHPLFVLDAADGKIIQANLAAKLQGFQPGKKCHAGADPSGLSCFSHPEEDCPLEDVKKTRMPVTVEHRHVNLAGETLLYEVSAYPLFAANGNVIQVLEYCLDVTERRQSEKRLREQKDLLSNLLARIPYAVYWKDDSCRYLGCNILFANLIGLDHPDQIIGKTDHELNLRLKEAAFSLATDIKVITDKSPFLNIEEVRTDSAGREGVFQTSKVPLTDSQGRVIGVLSISADISDQKKEDELKKQLFDDLARVNQELRETQSQLLQSEKMSAIGQLSAGVAHEVKNPLAIIMLSVESLEMMFPEMDPQEREKLVMIKEAAERANRVVSDLLSFSRQSALKVVSFNLQEVVNKSIELAKNKAKLKNIQFETDYESEEPLLMEGDPVLIMQITLNLLTNAVDAISQEGVVTIQVRTLVNPKTKAPEVELIVRDTGCGMPAEIQKRIFEPFYTTKEQGEGTGLGLSLVYRIVEKHQGKISVESREGEGTAMTVVLPLQPDLDGENLFS